MNGFGSQSGKRFAHATARWLVVVIGFFAIILIAGCAGVPWAAGQKDPENRFGEPLLSSPSLVAPPIAQPLPISRTWAGRISLRIEVDPVQFFSAGFELAGVPAAGTLVLTSPLGNVLGTLRWSPGEALLDRGNGQKAERFESVAELLQQTTGAELPLEALFAWLGDAAPSAAIASLEATSSTAKGWRADLSRRSEGRITARRNQPLPEADLRIVLDSGALPAGHAAP